MPDSINVNTTNPEYDQLAPGWIHLTHALHGTGGFATGEYLVAHPREWEDFEAPEPKVPTKKLKARRQLARYENLAAMIIGSKRAALFRQPPTRTLKDGTLPALRQWWEDADGNGHHLSDLLADCWVETAGLAHSFLLVDRGEDEQTFRLCPYNALNLVDWLQEASGRLTAVMLREAKPREALGEQPSGPQYRVRIVDEERWTVYEADGRRVDSGAHGFGRLPGVMLYAKRSSASCLLGQSVLHDPKLFIDHYNLTSELRELLRSQTFGVLNVPLGTGPDAVSVERAQAMLGNTTGTNAVLFSPEKAGYVSPDPANVGAYQAERADLTRMIYRLCNVPWEADSKDAEAEGSLQLKREDTNLVLAGYADFLEAAEYELAEIIVRGVHGDGWATVLEAAGLAIRYPDTFEQRPVRMVLDEAQAALSLDWPRAVTAEIQRRNLGVILPDLPDAKKQELEAAIDQSIADADPDEQMNRRFRALGALPVPRQPANPTSAVQ